MKKDANFGMLTTFVGGTLWGINGVMGSFLFLYKNITTNWLIPYRLVFAGLLLLGYLYYKQGPKIFDILKMKILKYLMELRKKTKKLNWMLHFLSLKKI